MVIKDYKIKTYLRRDTAVPTDNNKSAKKYNNISQYKDLEREIFNM